MEKTTTLPTAFVIAGNIQRIIADIIANGGEITEEQSAELESLQSDLATKARNYNLVKLDIDAEIEKAKAIKAMVDSRIKVLEYALKNLNRRLVSAMNTANVKKIESNDKLFSVTLCKGREKVVVEDVRLLDFDYCTIEEVYKPKTDDIKIALKNGKEVKGAHIETGEDYLRFSLKKKADDETNNTQA